MHRRQPRSPHAGLSNSFFGMFKETTLACLFDIGGLIAGFAIALQLGVFQLSPWAIALYPAVVSVKGVITGITNWPFKYSVASRDSLPQVLWKHKDILQDNWGNGRFDLSNKCND